MNAATLPVVAVADSGKILCVDAQGQWVVSNDQYIPIPTESMNINANGTYDVTRKAQVVVNVDLPSAAGVSF